MRLGDVVEFNVSTDRRDNLQRAVNIKLISVCLKNGQTREVGVVSSLKEGFGFIKCADQDLSIFFHFSEVLEQVRFPSVVKLHVIKLTENRNTQKEKTKKHYRGHPGSSKINSRYYRIRPTEMNGNIFIGFYQ